MLYLNTSRTYEGNVDLINYLGYFQSKVFEHTISENVLVLIKILPCFLVMTDLVNNINAFHLKYFIIYAEHSRSYGIHLLYRIIIAFSIIG